MTAIAATFRQIGARARSADWAWLFVALVFAALAAFDLGQAQASVVFVADAFLQTGAFLVLAVMLAAYAKASGADTLIADAFRGNEVRMIFIAALFGGLSPFCSCGVIPLIAALLAMGVPLSAVMAFWLSSPIMDPSMFALTAGVIGTDFAIAKTLAAIGLGMFGGYVTYALSGNGLLSNPLREGVGNGGCAGGKVRKPSNVFWPIWKDPARVGTFGRETRSVTLFLGKWLLVAFTLESLMLAYIPAEWITGLLGGGNLWAIPASVLTGVPAYLNGYAALGLVDGLMAQGMAPGAAMAFLVAGGVTSIPAAIAVYALARPKVFGLYLGLSVTGALIAGYGFQAYAMI